MHRIDLYTIKYGSSSFSYVWWAWTYVKFVVHDWCFISWIRVLKQLSWSIPTMLVIWTFSRHTKLSDQKVQWNSLLTWSLKKFWLLLFFLSINLFCLRVSTWVKDTVHRLFFAKDNLIISVEDWLVIFIFAQIDCTTEGKKCSEHNIRGFPSLKLFKDGREVCTSQFLADIK